MSLYAGIRLQKGAQPASTQGKEEPISLAPSISNAVSDNAAAVPSTAATADTTTNTVAEGDKGKASWSAALRFAPTIRKKPAGQASRAVPSAFSRAFASAEDATVNAVKTPRIVGNAKPSLATPAPASSATGPSPQGTSLISQKKESTNSSAPLPVTTVIKPVPSSAPHAAATGSKPRRVIAKPPPMTLDDDEVTGPKHVTQQQRNELRKNKKRSKRKEDPALQFGDVNYDPSRPCDYSAFKAYLQALRTQRRIEREERRRRERSYSESDSESGSDQQSDADARMLKKARLFAPPASYEDPSPKAAHEPSEQPANPGLAPRAETGEEAYQRRLAMSARPPQPQTQPSTAVAPAPSFAPTTHHSTTLSASAPSFAPQSGYSGTGTSFANQPRAPPAFFAPPGSEDFPPFDAVPSRASPSLPAQVGTTSTLSSLSDAQAKAKEIAARLGKLSGGFPPPPQPTPPAPVEQPSMPNSAPSEPDNRSFADRMMAKFGWEEGKGLGANEAGMTSALAVSRAGQASAASKKNQKGKNAVESGTQVPTGMGASRATIIDSTREARLANQKAEYGEPSRVVLLTNLCGLDEVDDELGNEVADEASKFGVVERCMVWPVPGETRDDQAVRVFLVMSGLAGGYNAVKQFDGRFFGGRTVKARFYDEKAFQRGERML
ncbi:hypothetical protein OIO90_000492 [Microbotryomycetes sp. JL221]|nr:hypothetical protein OIO90_000492 [Microbotryomycetes sp. JL221]